MRVSQRHVGYFEPARRELSGTNFAFDVTEGHRRGKQQHAVNCSLLGYYAASNGNSLKTGCPETPARNYHYSLLNSPEECSTTYFVAEA
jgi:hypothetical protein